MTNSLNPDTLGTGSGGITYSASEADLRFGGNVDYTKFQASDNAAWHTITPPAYRYRLHCNESFSIDQQKRPNAWWRFWQWALLGWTWEAK